MGIWLGKDKTPESAWEYTTRTEGPYNNLLDKLLTRMAKDGWELVSQSTIQTTAFTGKIVYTFRRRKKQ